MFNSIPHIMQWHFLPSILLKFIPSLSPSYFLPFTSCLCSLYEGLKRSEFVNRDVTYEEHIERDHNLWFYLYFIVYLKSKRSTEFTGSECYVYEMITVRDTLILALTALTHSHHTPLTLTPHSHSTHSHSHSTHTHTHAHAHACIHTRVRETEYIVVSLSRNYVCTCRDSCSTSYTRTCTHTHLHSPSGASEALLLWSGEYALSKVVHM